MHNITSAPEEIARISGLSDIIVIATPEGALLRDEHPDGSSGTIDFTRAELAAVTAALAKAALRL